MDIVLAVWSIYITYLLFIFRREIKQLSSIKLTGDLADTLTTQDKKIKIGLTKFNLNGKIGGEQSFCLAILDGNNYGVVVTSLHGKDFTRIYAKEVKADNIKEVNYLSKEEQEAYKKAQG